MTFHAVGEHAERIGHGGDREETRDVPEREYLDEASSETRVVVLQRRKGDREDHDPGQRILEQQGRDDQREGEPGFHEPKSRSCSNRVQAVRVAERNKDWEQVIRLNQKVLDLTLKYNFRDDLPAVHLDFAKAFFNLNQLEKSLEHLEKSLAIIEGIRASENINLTLGILETYHSAYRLLTQIKSKNSQEAFELADFLKARFLKDKINNSSVKNDSTISEQTRKLLEELSLKYIDDDNLAIEIEKNEKLISTKIPELHLK